jgi:hypothetical protein
MFFNAVALVIWMLMKGVDPDKWGRHHGTMRKDPLPL